MGNGEWGMGNGEWGMGSRESGVGRSPHRLAWPPPQPSPNAVIPANAGIQLLASRRPLSPVSNP
ncbi:hypothetical protein FKV25_04190 [Lysobacter aestuarii]|uniref:Uncharacterized protein n=1 Tax=Marilutibacter aestuarii TaxID=1706195 RepID=A0A508ARA8_9GAMM|nr:hypothetical protein FKV25_04190 [Lysobacter aestuarii]